MKLTPKQHEQIKRNLAWCAKKFPYAVYDTIYVTDEMPLIHSCVSVMQNAFKQLITGRK